MLLSLVLLIICLAINKKFNLSNNILIIEGIGIIIIKIIMCVLILEYVH